MARSNPYKNYYQSFMTENMNPLYKRYLEYLMEDLPDVSDIGGYFDVPTTAEREGIESLDTEIKTPMAPMNQTRGGGGDGEPRGIGRFQNLDPRSEKMVLVNGVPTKVYRNITSGLLQTFDGKNVKGDVNTQTGAFDYEEDAYGIPSIYSASFPPSLSSKFSLDKQRETAIQNQTVYEQKLAAEKKAKEEAERRLKQQMESQNISRQEAQQQNQAIRDDQERDRNRDRASQERNDTGYDSGNYCFDPNTLIQMADGSEKKIKEIQLGDQTKGGEVTGVFQFKASDEIHDYKGVTVAGSHYVKEDGKFIMVKDSPVSVKIDKIPVVYSLDTTGRRIFINNSC